MSTSQGGATENPAEVVSYLPFVERNATTTPRDARRLVWTLDHDLSLKAAILVKDTSPSLSSQKPYYDSTTETWHEISQSSLFKPKISSIIVHVYQFDLWEENWLERHLHCEPPSDSDSENGVRWGIITDDSDGSDYGDEAQLLECCGEPRPIGKAKGKLVEASSDGQGFVTVHDYVSTIHPWLMSVYEDILVAHEDAVYVEPLPSGTQFLVQFGSPQLLTLDLKHDKNILSGEALRLHNIQQEELSEKAWEEKCRRQKLEMFPREY
ncbi:hypothetical protein VTL71DRAFT_4978 [Oculimacula yallundae]|uniref:Uncharacterized protein n=1 Tax=Oculimacula yallundae TaxID=86028 RepID=A0ABR4C3J6_9HELO